MNSCVDCNASIDSKTGLICSQCRIPICVNSCFKNHSNHRLQNIPSTGDGINSKLQDADRTFNDLKMCSSASLDLTRTLNSEILNHQLKLYNFKDRASRGEIGRQQLELFEERHNQVLKSVLKAHDGIFDQLKELYKYWGNIVGFNYDSLLSVRKN